MRPMSMILSCVFVSCAAVLAVPSALSAERFELTGSTMGTYYSIVIDSPQAVLKQGEELQAKIEARLQEINRQMSTWDPESEISTFNRSTSTDWFEVSAEFAAVVVEAKRIYELSDGAFDPTVSELVNLWGFGDRRPKQIPDDAAIQAALKQVGMQHVSVRMDPPALQKQIPELQLNLSAIAKGYGVDALAELLVAEGQPSFVVDIGGEDRTGLPKASGDAWKLGIESPLGGIRRIVPLTEMSIATSGDYRNSFTIDGVVYSHAIDPTTGRPVPNPPASVSVLHPSCMTADAWATAMMILGSEKGTQVAEANGLSVLFQDVRNAEIVESATGTFVKTAVQADEAQVAAAESQNVTESGSSDVGDGADAENGLLSGPWFPFVAAAVIFLLAIGGMAIGTIVQNKTIKGSCGGLASMPGSDGKSICELCTIPKDQCTNAELREQMQAAAAANDDHDDEASSSDLRS